jgi:hypothetical protein
VEPFPSGGVPDKGLGPQVSYRVDFGFEVEAYGGAFMLGEGIVGFSH